MTEFQQLLADAADKLAALGTTRQVALELAALGIRAVPRCTSRCVLAEWFTDELAPHGECWIDIGRHHDHWTAHAHHQSGHTATVTLAEHVGQLATEFDAGLWPQLEVTR